MNITTSYIAQREGYQAFKEFRKNKTAWISLYILGILALVALLAPIIANDKPLFIRYEGAHYFPAFSFKNKYTIQHSNGQTEIIQLDIADWKHMRFDKVIWAPVPYSSNTFDGLNANFKSPGGEQLFRDANGNIAPMPSRFRHRLGTDNLGYDTLSGLIHGTRISLTIGFISMAIASIIGLLLGAIAGYFGDHRLHTRIGVFWTVIAGLPFAWFYGFQTRRFDLAAALLRSGWTMFAQIFISLLVFAVVIACFYIIGKLLAKLPFLNKKMSIPVDAIVSRTIEIFHSLPTFILIITVAAIARPSLVNMMIIIGLTSWTGIARLTRAEFLRLRNLEFIQAARALGLSEFKIITKHALPNGIAPALVAIAFGIASAILIESSLSFLGVGVPANIVTWGSLINEGREKFSAWWLVIFPGIAIFLTVTVYNLIGEGLRDALDPKQRR